MAGLPVIDDAPRMATAFADAAWAPSADFSAGIVITRGDPYQVDTEDA